MIVTQEVAQNPETRRTQKACTRTNRVLIPVGRICFAALGLLVATASPLRANPVDLFGLGAREAAMGNAFTAVADDPFAAYYNLGGLSQVKRTAISIGLQLGHASLGDPDLCPEPDGIGCSEPFYYTEGGILTTQQKRYGYDQPHGLALGLAVPLTEKLNFGMAAYLPIDVRFDEDGHLSGIGLRLARFQTTDAYLPDYILYQNRAQRFSVYSGIAYEIVPGLGIGLGATILAGADLQANLKATVHVEDGAPDEQGNPTTAITNEIDTQLSMGLETTVSPIAGLFWNLGSVKQELAGWQLGLVYRGESKMTAAANIDADLAIAVALSDDGAPFSYGTVVTDIGADVVGFFTPQQAGIGVSGLLANRLRLAADVTWVDWSAFLPTTTTLPESVQLVLGIDLTLENSREIDTAGFRDIAVPRLGIEGRLGPYFTDTVFKGMDVYLRAGGAFEKNPFPRQTLETNLLNSDRIISTAGLGITTHNPLSQNHALPVSLDLSLQHHYLLPTLHQKEFAAGDAPLDGYPMDGSYTSLGSVLQGSLTLQLGF